MVACISSLGRRLWRSFRRLVQRVGWSCPAQREQWEQAWEVVEKSCENLGVIWGAALAESLCYTIALNLKVAEMWGHVPQRIEHTSAHVVLVWQQGPWVVVYACDVIGRSWWWVKIPENENEVPCLSSDVGP